MNNSSENSEKGKVENGDEENVENDKIGFLKGEYQKILNELENSEKNSQNILDKYQKMKKANEELRRHVRERYNEVQTLRSKFATNIESIEDNNKIVLENIKNQLINFNDTLETKFFNNSKFSILKKGKFCERLSEFPGRLNMITEEESKRNTYSDLYFDLLKKHKQTVEENDEIVKAQDVKIGRLIKQLTKEKERNLDLKKQLRLQRKNRQDNSNYVNQHSFYQKEIERLKNNVRELNSQKYHLLMKLESVNQFGFLTDLRTPAPSVMSSSSRRTGYHPIIPSNMQRKLPPSSKFNSIKILSRDKTFKNFLKKQVVLKEELKAEKDRNVQLKERISEFVDEIDQLKSEIRLQVLKLKRKEGLLKEKHIFSKLQKSELDKKLKDDKEGNIIRYFRKKKGTKGLEYWDYDQNRWVDYESVGDDRDHFKVSIGSFDFTLNLMSDQKKFV